MARSAIVSVLKVVQRKDIARVKGGLVYTAPYTSIAKGKPYKLRRPDPFKRVSLNQISET